MTETEVVIVGGGLAGLKLAQKLEQAGRDYQLLEARDRFGGRVLSSAAIEPAFGRHDLGPSWVWPGQPLVRKLLEELDITAYPQYSEGKLVFEESPGAVRRDLDFSTMAGSLRIEGGVASLTDALAARLDSHRLHSECRVTALSQNDSGVEVTASSIAGEVRFRCDWCVFALPPRVVESTITFEPPFAPDLASSARAVPTWMAGHAKVVAVYETPFWRGAGFSGDGISRCGPLAEIHDATPFDEAVGALFGFVALPAGAPERGPDALKHGVVQQLGRMFGDRADRPLDVLIKDWAEDDLTATVDDRRNAGHPQYGMPSSIALAAERRLLFCSSEMAGDFGGLLEGALDAAEAAARKLLAG